MELTGKTFIVTGSDNNIGKGLISILLSKGCKVIAVHFKESVLHQTIYSEKENKDSLTILSVDITDEKSVKSLYEKSLSLYGTIDGIINNAGIVQPFQKWNDLSFEAIERIFNINYYETLHLAKIFLPHLLSSAGAYLVLSMGSPFSFSQKTGYKTSQTISSLKMLVEGLRSELLDTAIKVMLVSSGVTLTNNQIIKNDSSKISSFDAAAAIVNGMEKELAYLDLAKNSTQVPRPELFIYRMKKAMYKFFKQ